MGVARGNDTDVNGLVGDVRHADARLAVCGRSFVAVVAWNELPRQKPAFLVAVRDTRDFRLVPCEIKHAAPLALFAIQHGSLYNGPEKIPVRYVLALALAVDQVRELVFSFNPLSVFVAQVRGMFCVLSARKSPSSKAIILPAALRLGFRAFFAVLVTISIVPLLFLSTISIFLSLPCC
jgi:hypothetical protein